MSHQFVILLHEHPNGDHWDLMFEAETALTTWAILPQPLPPKFFECCAKILPDHRFRYLDYEGPISNNRGFVRRIDAGIYEIVQQNCFQLHGKIFNGILSIDGRSEDHQETSLRYHPDR